MKGTPYLSLGFVWLHQLHHLALLYQNDLGVSEPGNVQGRSCDECTHTCGAALQSLQGEEESHGEGGLWRRAVLHKGTPRARPVLRLIFMLYGENVCHSTPFRPNVELAGRSAGAGSRPLILKTGMEGWGGQGQRAGRFRHDQY